MHHALVSLMFQCLLLVVGVRRGRQPYRAPHRGLDVKTEPLDASLSHGAAQRRSSVAVAESHHLERDAGAVRTAL